MLIVVFLLASLTMTGVTGDEKAASVTACTAGAIDLSLTTGCNVAFYVGGIFP